MNPIFKDKEYISIVNNILSNKKFKKLINLQHHMTNRLEHSLRVSYFSYNVSRLLGLDKKQTARAGLLHDFFLDDLSEDKKKKFTNVFTHSETALNNSLKYFDLSEKEQDIIYTHMFPQVPNKLPKYAESWIVCIIDKLVTVYEFGNSYGTLFQLKFRNTLVILALLFTRAF